MNYKLLIRDDGRRDGNPKTTIVENGHSYCYSEPVITLEMVDAEIAFDALMEKEVVQVIEGERMELVERWRTACSD